MNSYEIVEIGKQILTNPKALGSIGTGLFLFSTENVKAAIKTQIEANSSEKKELPDDPFYNKVDKYFSSLTFDTPKEEIHKKTTEFMQENIIKFFLYMEQKFESKNIPIFKMVEAFNESKEIASEFKTFFKDNINRVKESGFGGKQLSAFASLDIPEEKKKYMALLMEFCKQNFQYKAGGDFVSMLSNPNQGEFIGDCNEIASLYTALYGLRYPIEDLKVVLHPRHVSLDFFGMEIETTSHYVKGLNASENTFPISNLPFVNSTDGYDSAKNPEKDLQNTLVFYKALPFYFKSKSERFSDLQRAYFNVLVTNFSIAKLDEFKSQFDNKILLYPNSKLNLYQYLLQLKIERTGQSIQKNSDKPNPNNITLFKELMKRVEAEIKVSDGFKSSIGPNLGPLRSLAAKL